VEGDRHQSPRELPSVQDGLGRTGPKRPHWIVGPAGRKLLGDPGHGLDPGAAAGNGDPVTAVQVSGCCRRVAVHQDRGRVSVLAEDAVVDRQQVPGGLAAKTFQGLLHRQAGWQ
jgi:hypothetical protein